MRTAKAVDDILSKRLQMGKQSGKLEVMKSCSAEVASVEGEGCDASTDLIRTLLDGVLSFSPEKSDYAAVFSFLAKLKGFRKERPRNIIKSGSPSRPVVSGRYQSQLRLCP